jgi:hypothetical protein
MVHYRKKDVKLKPFFIASIVFCVVAVALGLIIGSSNSNYQLEEANPSYKLSSGADIVRRGEAMYNDTIYLTRDITVTDPNATIGSSKHPFSGVFDGQGHTIYFSYGEATEETSLFNYIAPGAVVKNVNFVFSNVSVSGASFGGIAKINDGTIENCKVVFEKLIINGEGLFSPLVVMNRGSISNVYVKGLVSGNVSSSVEDKVLYGNICVYNSGTLSNLVADADYEGFLCTDETGYREGTTSNVGISAVRCDDIEGGVTMNAVGIVADGHVSSDMFGMIEFSDSNDVYNFNKIFNQLRFDNSIWEIGDNDLILLVEESVK